jgi:hypothetical protein
MDYAGGSIELPTGPGLGLKIDPAKLHQYATAYESDGQAVSYADADAGQISTVPNV